MMRSILQFVASGNRYKPSRISYDFSSKHDFDAIKERGKDIGATYGYGASTLRFEDGIWDNQWSAMIRNVGLLMPQMKEAAAEHFQVQFIVLNSEGIVLSLDAEHIQFLAANACDMRMSYGVEKEPIQHRGQFR